MSPHLAPEPRPKRTLIICYNTALYVVKFRMNLIAALQARGYRVVVAAPTDQAVPALERAGAVFEHVAMSAYGMGPVENLRLVGSLTRLIRRHRPAALLNFTIKPNIFASLAGLVAGTPAVNNVAGAGRAFGLENRLIRATIMLLMRTAFTGAHTVFFQNAEDHRDFVSRGLVPERKAARLPGSGVDLARFAPSEPPEGATVFLFVGRLLTEKGVNEFLEAGRRLRAEGARARFRLVGELDDDDGYVDRAAFADAMGAEGFEYLGAVPPAEMPRLVAASCCLVLPSYYREGVPRALLEACAAARPIITTDNVGCRDVVEDGVNGFRVPVRDAGALADAMRRFVDAPPAERLRMGAAGRAKVEAEFDERTVISAYLAVLDDIEAADARRRAARGRLAPVTAGARADRAADLR
mgnify:CR=1 FL=1